MKKTLIILAAVIAVVGLYWILQKSAAPKGPSIVKVDTSDGYKLLVNGQPYVVKGVCYSPIPIGKDYEYNFWGDPNKPWLVDGPLMEKMGVNTVRFYRLGKNPEEVKQVLDDLYHQFGIRALMGTYLGFWNWPPPNYADPVFREKVRAEVIEMVRLYKDHPGVLVWVLGNENNYSFDQSVQRWSTDEIDAMPDPEDQRKAKARIYYAYINDLAKEIKSIDANHPVVMGVGETKSLDIAAEVAPDVDIIGMIAYRGSSFGNLFRQVKQRFDKPVLLIEWGADSYNVTKREPDEPAQAEFLKFQWKDIARNLYTGNGERNCLGGTLFSWNDEWWKGNENIPMTWAVHDTGGHWRNSSYHYDAYGADPMNMNEEWWGVVSLDPKLNEQGIHTRVPKAAYSVLQTLWTGESSAS